MRARNIFDSSTLRQLPTVKLEELEHLVVNTWQIAAPKKLKKNRA